jgi:hypothetical protein
VIGGGRWTGSAERRNARVFHRIATIDRGEPAVRLVRAVREFDAEHQGLIDSASRER